MSEIQPTNEGSSATGSNFETEVAWCVAQIELGMKRKDATPQQIAEAKNIIAKLTSPTLPLVKKRHLMRVTFGDYRALMKDPKYK
jgi:hypothetical protein